jgi:hypothetical protein
MRKASVLGVRRLALKIPWATSVLGVWSSARACHWEGRVHNAMCLGVSSFGLRCNGARWPSCGGRATVPCGSSREGWRKVRIDGPMLTSRLGSIPSTNPVGRCHCMFLRLGGVVACRVFWPGVEGRFPQECVAWGLCTLREPTRRFEWHAAYKRSDA